MIRRRLLVATTVLPPAALAAALAAVLAAPAARAASLEDQVEERLLGAWVVTGTELRSDCNGGATNNRVNGAFVKSDGRFGFAPGELAKVERVDARRSRLDVRLALAEPVLAARREGPFTLYDERRCSVDLEIEVPREAVKAKDVAEIEKRLTPVLERFATADAARDAERFNGRVRESFPEDYDRTLREYGAWRAEQTNAAVQAALDRARDEAGRVGERMQTDAPYLQGFAAGFDDARAGAYGSCETLVARVPGARPSEKNETDEQRRIRLGRNDGFALGLWLDALRRLPGCFVPVPRP